MTEGNKPQQEKMIPLSFVVWCIDDLRNQVVNDMFKDEDGKLCDDMPDSLTIGVANLVNEIFAQLRINIAIGPQNTGSDNPPNLGSDK